MLLLFPAQLLCSHSALTHPCLSTLSAHAPQRPSSHSALTHQCLSTLSAHAPQHLSSHSALTLLSNTHSAYAP